MKKIKWIFIIAGLLFFVCAIYLSETSRLQKLNEIAQSYNSKKKDTIGNLEKGNSKTTKKTIYINEINGDTLDLSKDKFIIISADKFRDKNITYGISIWYDMNTCAWSPGILKISVYDKNLKLLKTEIAKIEVQLGEACTQLEELNLFMGDLIQQAIFINAEFTDDRGEKYYQTRKRLDDIVDLKPSTDNLAKEERLALKKIKHDTRILFNELISFKDKEDFHLYGFATTYKYNKWLKKVKVLKEDSTNKLLLLTDGFVVGDLEMLGLEYMGSEGQETDYSEYAKERIEYGLGIK